MALTVALGGDARDDLTAIEANRRTSSPGAADKVISAIGRSILLLSEHPCMERRVELAPYREKPVPRTPDIILYRLVGDTILVLPIFYGRMDRPFP